MYHTKTEPRLRYRDGFRGRVVAPVGLVDLTATAPENTFRGSAVIAAHEWMSCGTGIQICKNDSANSGCLTIGAA